MQDVTLGVADDPDVSPMLNLLAPTSIKWIHPKKLVDDFGKGFHDFAAEVAEIIINSDRLDAVLSDPSL